METIEASTRRPETGEKCGLCATPVPTPATTTTRSHPAEAGNPQPIRRRWVGLFLGRLLLRICPKDVPNEPCDGCQLRALCKCAQEDFTEAARVERRVWMVLLGCSLVALLMVIFAR